MLTHLQFHPVTEIFPPMEPAVFQALVDDIAVHGQQDPILVLKGEIIDGRHRYQACQQLGREPLLREIQLNAGDPLALVISLNLHRRHLSESQRAVVAARLANMPRSPGLNQHVIEVSANLQRPQISQASAAEVLNVSTRSVAAAKKVLDQGCPGLVAAVDRGDLPVSTAAELTRLPPDTQNAVLTRTPEEIRAIAQEVKQRIQSEEVAGPSAVRVFDQVALEQGLSGFEQVAVAEIIDAETPVLPTPSQARRLAAEGAPGLMVLASDNQYHGAPVTAEQALKRERWFQLRAGLEALADLGYDAEAAIAAVPSYQDANVSQWLAKAVPFLNTLHQIWRQRHA
jgi:ParB-like chromosome segregation protein Spo0J